MARSKINTPFVIALTAVLFLIGSAGVIAGYLVLSKSGAEYEALGDEAAAEQDWTAAVRYYGSAVAHDPSNIGWLQKWASALSQDVPTDPREYNERYAELRSAIREIARVSGTDIGRHADFNRRRLEHQRV